MEKASPLSISDIRKWLLDNRDEYQKLAALEFPPLYNEVYWTYNHLHDFIGYCQFFHECRYALKNLKPFLNYNFSEIIKWTKTHEILGSQKLLMFEVNHICWDEEVSEEVIKIHKGLYTERKPLADIICFCEIFQLVYWDKNIHEIISTEQEQSLIREELQNIYDRYFRVPEDE